MKRDPCPAVAQLDHVALATSALERLCDFYVLLGAVPSPPWTDLDTGLRACLLDFCGVHLEVMERGAGGEGAPTGERSLGLLHLGFALESADAVDEVTRAIAAAGHRVLRPPRRAGARGRYESVVADPDGNPLTLSV
jgi:lactoylglutathione lyase